MWFSVACQPLTWEPEALDLSRLDWHFCNVRESGRHWTVLSFARKICCHVWACPELSPIIRKKHPFSLIHYFSQFLFKAENITHRPLPRQKNLMLNEKSKAASTKLESRRPFTIWKMPCCKKTSLAVCLTWAFCFEPICPRSEEANDVLDTGVVEWNDKRTVVNQQSGFACCSADVSMNMRSLVVS